MVIEVERRGFIDEERFLSLPDLIINLGGKDLGKNDTQTVFYLSGQQQVKVQLSTSKGCAKVAWKSGGVGGLLHREEVELNILVEDFDNAELLMQRILPNARRIETEQRRHDFILHEVSIAIKYSFDWGYHVELERLVCGQSEVKDALKNIGAVASKLGLLLLEPEDEKRFVEKKIAAKK